MANSIDYPTNPVVGALEEKVCKHQWLALAVDFVREQIGEDAPDEAVQAVIVRRLDTLHRNKIVPRSVPAHFPRAQP